MAKMFRSGNYAVFILINPSKLSDRGLKQRCCLMLMLMLVLKLHATSSTVCATGILLLDKPESWGHL